MQSLGGVGAMHIFSPIMLSLCLMLFSTHYAENYAENYAGIIGAGLTPFTLHELYVIAFFYIVIMATVYSIRHCNCQRVTFIFCPIN